MGSGEMDKQAKEKEPKTPATAAAAATTTQGSQQKSGDGQVSFEAQASQNGNSVHVPQNGGPNSPHATVNQAMAMVPMPGAGAAPLAVAGPTIEPEEEEEEDKEQEALHLKALSEIKYNNSKVKSALKYAKRAQCLAPHLDGISEMVTSFKILCVAAARAPDNPMPDWYKILKVEPFTHINTIKKQYKKLALVLHPDKSPYARSEDAFKLANEAFQFLSDKIRRKEYDMKLRIRIQEENVVDLASVDTYWTACLTCRLLHKFERRYLGHNLVCPNCKKSFEAVEAEVNDGDEGVKTGFAVRTAFPVLQY